ncbi:MAG: DUF5050 domain-containing protein [Coriobacteriales bacterium]|nr:DUF5050 domain-containing protein [Coriobacteriales bacterium]
MAAIFVVLLSATSGHNTGVIPQQDSQGSTVQEEGQSEEAKKKAEEEAKKKAASELTTSKYNVGNLVNGGHMGMDTDGHLYYAEPVDGTDWDTKSIARCESDGSNRSVIYRGAANSVNLYHINAAAGRLFFNEQTDSGSTVVSVKFDGGDVRTLDACDDWSLCQVDGGWVYYIKGGVLCRCDATGGKREELAQVGSEPSWRVAGNKLFTFVQDSGTDVYMSDISGASRKSVYAPSSGFTVRNSFPIGEDTLMVLEKDSANNSHVVKVDLKTGVANSIHEETGEWNVQRMCACDEGIVITSAGSGGAYSIDLIDAKGSTRTLFVSQNGEGEVRYTTALGSKAYFGLVNGGQCSLNAVGVKGGTMQVIAD